MSNEFVPDPDTWYVLTFEHSDRVLAVEGASTENGGNICQQDADGSRSQQWSFEEMEPGWYRVRARHSGKALGIAGQSTEKGANLHQWDARDHHGQQWSLSVSEGGFLLQSRHSSRLLTVADASAESGANVQQGRAKSMPHRRFQLTPVLVPAEKKWYTLVFEHSGKALAIEELSEDNGARTIQAAPDGSPRQQWWFDHVEDDWYMLRARHSNKAISIQSYSTEDGAVLHQWDTADKSNQQWRIVPVKGRYMLLSRHSGRLVDVSGGRTTDGVKVHQWGDETRPHRRMSITQLPDSTAFEPEPGAWYRISFAHSGKVLDVHGWDRDDGGNLIQYTDYGNSNQLFTFEKVEGSWYHIRARHSGKVIGVDDDSTSEGANIEQQTAVEGKTSQHWRVIHSDKGDAYVIRARHSDLALAVPDAGLEDRENVGQRGKGGWRQCERVHITRVCGAIPDTPPRALKIGAGDEPIRLPPSTLTKANGSMTMELWIRPNSSSGTQTLIEIADGKFDKSLVLERRDKDIRLFYYDRGTEDEQEILLGEDVLTGMDWAHVMVTLWYNRHANTRHGAATLYVDGEQVVRQTAAASGWVEPSSHGTLLGSRVLGECTIGGRRDGTNVFRGKMAEARFWTSTFHHTTIKARRFQRVRGDAEYLRACYRLDAKVDGRMLDSSCARAHAIAGAGTQIGNVPGLSLPPTTDAGIEAHTKLTREWLPKVAFDEDTRNTLAAGYGDLAEIESLSVEDIGPTSGDRVEASVYEVVLEPYDAGREAVSEALVYAQLGADQVVIVDDDGGEPRLEIWKKGRNKVRASPSGRVRLRFVATGTNCAPIFVRHARMPDSVWAGVFPDERNFGSMLDVKADALLQPAKGGGLPLLKGVTNLDSLSESEKADRLKDAEDVAQIVHKLARVGAPLDVLAQYDAASQDAGSGGFWNDVEDAFKDLSDAIEDVVEDVVEETSDVVWKAATSARSLVTNNVQALVDEAKKVKPRIGAKAIRECLSQADSLQVITSAVDELANVVQFVGETSAGYFRIVINQVEDAMEAMAAFFKRVGASIKDFIDMLADSLDWDRFLGTAEDIYDQVIGALNGAKTALKDERGADRVTQIGTEIATVRDWVDGGRTLGDLTGISVPEIPGMETMQYVLDQLQRLLASAKFSLPFSMPDLPDLRADWLDAVKNALPDSEILTTDFPELPADDLRDVVVKLWDDAGATMMDQPYKDLLGGAKSAINGIKDALRHRIDVPWLTEVIEQTILGGKTLNILRLLCVAAAIPVVLAKTAYDAGSEVVSFSAEEEETPLQWTQFGLAVLNSLLTTTRAVESASGKSLGGPKLAIVHGLFIMGQGAVECRQGDNTNDGKTIAAGTLNLLYGLVTGSIGLLEQLISSKRDDELTDSENNDLDALFLIGDVVLGMGYVGMALHTAITAEDGGDLASGVADANYWVATWFLGGVGLYASSRKKKALELITSLCSVQLNLAYTGKAIASGVA